MSYGPTSADPDWSRVHNPNGGSCGTRFGAGWHARHRINHYEPHYSGIAHRTLQDEPTALPGTRVATATRQDRGSYVEVQLEDGRSGAVPNDHGVTRIEVLEDAHEINHPECHFSLGERHASPALEGAHCVTQQTNEIGEVVERTF